MRATSALINARPPMAPTEPPIMTPLVGPGAAVAVGVCVGVGFGVTVTLMIIGVWDEEEVEVEDTILSANA